ncbi:hypothetical protein HPB47_008049 [Ixodes persulcatus]|uniref:Uncharacterized protein n=1 Tax=Ixodes persulcatus TaxID=34615 RepID=A0AC60P624_IXOPE|nr:hypothetical protein HPB47_008049 [Ixodes persulcatus]
MWGRREALWDFPVYWVLGLSRRCRLGEGPLRPDPLCGATAAGDNGRSGTLHRLGALGFSRFSFLVDLPCFEYEVRDYDVYGIAGFVGVLDTDRGSDENDCYREMLEAGHFDLDPLATNSSDDDDIVAYELAVVRRSRTFMPAGSVTVRVAEVSSPRRGAGGREPRSEAGLATGTRGRPVAVLAKAADHGPSTLRYAESAAISSCKWEEARRLPNGDYPPAGGDADEDGLLALHVGGHGST